MSGVDLDGREIRKGAADAVEALRRGSAAGVSRRRCRTPSTTIARRGSTPLVVADGDDACSGVIELKDIVKGGIKERFAELRRMGIKTVMITGDNRAHRRGDRGRSGRRRLPRRSDARSQARR